MPSNNPKLSVILPAYNAENYVEEAISSILGQTFEDFELLIADDASKDNTRNVINSFQDKRIRQYHNEFNKGKSQTVNDLFEKCHGDYVTIHDADDYSDLKRFEHQILWLDQNEDYKFCGTFYKTVDQAGKLFSENRLKTSWDEILESLHLSGRFHGPTVIFRREILEELDEIYRLYFKDNYEDVDLILRIISNGHKGVNLDQFLYNYRILEDSLCRKEVTVKNRNLFKIAIELYFQRKKLGFDYLMNNQPELVEELFLEITKEYRKDKSKIHREAAAYFNYWKFYDRAVNESFKAFIKSPFNLENIKTLLFCFKKMLWSKSFSRQ
ncbi:MAG: glycosyltransferase family 2 protein [Cytophagales bacterium]